MSKYTSKIFGHVFLIILLVIAGVANWFFPLVSWFGDTPLYRFIWLGIFFVIVDIIFEVIQRSMVQVQLVADMLSFGSDLNRLEKGFRVLSKPKLPNNAVVDYAIVGPSGTWLIVAKDRDGRVSFDGDELVQDGVILKGIITQSLQKSYALSELLRSKMGRDFKVASVVVFMSPKIDLGDMPSMIKGVYVTSRQKINGLIENTDVQILDSGTIEEIIRLLKNKIK
ncbi:MAG: NERD domain-containing protein [Candidatus Yanofskybacteria bacterium]|nr:NERD domain-containing protein [Candidatus Yanofskybacteria bacterium]